MEVADCFGSLRELATKCSMDEVSSHLQKEKMAWMRAYFKRMVRQFSEIRTVSSR